MTEERFFQFGKPSPFNLVADFAEKPDEILQILAKVGDYLLSPEQKFLAKQTGRARAKLCSDLTLLDLVEAWEKSPLLSDFAQKVRQNLLP
jgi:hypothetical protein